MTVAIFEIDSDRLGHLASGHLHPWLVLRRTLGAASITDMIVSPAVFDALEAGVRAWRGRTGRIRLPSCDRLHRFGLLSPDLSARWCR